MAGVVEEEELRVLPGPLDPTCLALIRQVARARGGLPTEQRIEGRLNLSATRHEDSLHYRGFDGRERFS